ncbi:MAG: TonB-dependent receptor, partial [bacterium]|nr:TonB-dependent receptor [bacterium]
MSRSIALPLLRVPIILTHLIVIYQIFTSVVLFAQEQDSTTASYELAPLTVTATRTERPIFQLPYAIDLVEVETISPAGLGLSLEDALQEIPGITVHNRHNLSQGDRIVIRGVGSRAPFGVRGVKIILDGIPLTFPDGQAQLNNLDLGSLGKIEILRGPSAFLYGNAAGGLINLHTRTGAPQPFQARPRILLGENGLRKGQAALSGQTAKHGYTLNLVHLEQDGHRTHAATRSTALNTVGRLSFNHLNLTTVFNYYNAPYLLNPSSLTKEDARTAPGSSRFFNQQQGAGKRVHQGQAGITLRYHPSTLNLQTTLYAVKRTLFNPIPGRIIDLDRTSWGLRTVLSNTKRLTHTTLRWTLGADLETQYDTRLEFENQGLPEDNIPPDQILNRLQFGPKLLDQKENVLGFGPFAELALDLSKQWTLTLGGRYDRSTFKVTDRFHEDGIDNSGTRTMTQLSPTIGLTWNPRPLLTLYTNFTTAFQTPTTTELGNRPTGEGGFNPDLQPEKLHSLELGIRGHHLPAHLEYSFALYRMKFQDMLIPYQIPQSEETYFRNAGKSRNTGFESRLTWTPLRELRATLAYTFTHFIFTDFQLESPTVQLSGKKVPGVSPHQLTTSLTYIHPTGLYPDLNTRWTARY